MERVNDTVIFGYLETLRAVQSNEGETIVFGTFILSKNAEIVFFPKVWEECRRLVNVGDIVYLKGQFDDINLDKLFFNVSSIIDIK